jgi:hypothetical protein
MKKNRRAKRFLVRFFVPKKNYYTLKKIKKFVSLLKLIIPKYMRYNTILIRIFMLISFVVTSQVLDDTAKDKLVTNYESRTTTQFKENIYIHTDKDIYEPGEDLWFKVYMLNANDFLFGRSRKYDIDIAKSV